MEEKKLVPKLRFPGFTEPWEQRKLIDIAKTFIGLVTTMTENYRDSGTLLIRNSDIKEGQFVFSEKPIHLDEEFAEKNKTRRLQIGDVVTVHTGDIGTSAVIQEKEAGSIGFATINTRTDKRILNPYFLSTYFNTEKHKCYANSVSTGDGRSNYNIKDFNKLVISIPSLDEQEKISVLINNINTIITLHQRKLEHLKLKKKSLLQKLFPKEGEVYPELRFPGFTDPWEQRKLGECVDISTGYPFDSQDFNENGEYLVITNGNIQENTPFVLNNVGNRIDLDDSLKKYILDIDDLLITMDGTVGRVAIVVDNKLVLAQRVCRIKSNEPYYIYQLLSKNDFIRSMNKIGHGGTIKHISLSEISEYQAFYPKSQKERIKISSVLTNYDELITLHQRKLEHLQLLKKALLQQLFV